MNRNIVLFLSVLMGLFIDIFGYTMGLNTLVMTIVGFLRYYFLKLFTPKDIFDEYIPSFLTLGKFGFIRYTGALTLVHIIVLFSVESFTFFDPILLIVRIISSFVLTILLIFAFESLNFNAFKK
jgi:rod shape-determining protein MreD